MSTNVELQDPASYSLWPILVLGIITALVLCLLIVTIIIQKRRKSMPLEKVIEKHKSKTDIYSIKAKYLAEMERIEKQYKDDDISARTAYQRLSKCTRKFVYELIGIKVQSYTLEDIRNLEIPVLTELINEYYVPEFAKNPNGDVIRSIEKTKRAVERWN